MHILSFKALQCTKIINIIAIANAVGISFVIMCRYAPFQLGHRHSHVLCRHIAD